MTKTKALATIILSALGLALLGYSASRGLDFVMATLPPDKQTLAFFALAATEGGVVAWPLFYLYAARGGVQRAIAIIALVTDLAGAIALFTADTLFRSGEVGLTAQLTQEEIRTVILGLSALIAANIIYVIGCHLFDVDAQKQSAQEEARDKIEAAALKRLSKDADNVAAELAPTLAAAWLNDLRNQLTNGVIDLPALPVTDSLREARQHPANSANSSANTNGRKRIFDWLKRPARDGVNPTDEGA